MQFKYLSIGFIFFFTHPIFSQNTLSGTIIDDTKQILPFVNVILYSLPDTILIGGAIADENGHFTLKNVQNGTFQLVLSFVGYQHSKSNLEVNGPTDLGQLILNKTTNNLNTITVSEKRVLVQRKIDRLIFDVANSGAAFEGDALNVLSISPGIQVQNDQISIVGKSTVAVMIDGKILPLAGNDLSNFLKSIASENIQSIEIITAPPAQYEASGNSGLVNIILKKAKRDAWNALIQSRFWQQSRSNASIGGNFSIQKNKLNCSTSIYARKGTYRQEQDDYAYFPDGLWYTYSPFLMDYEGVNARISTQYAASENWNTGIQYIYSQTQNHLLDAPYTAVFDYDTNEITRYLQSESTADISPKVHSINFYNDFNLDTSGRKLTINLDYFNFQKPDQKFYSGASVIEDPFSEQFFTGTNTNLQRIHNFSGKFDFVVPAQLGNLNFGGKVTFSKSKNDIQFYNSGLVEASISDFTIEKNHFSYLETVSGLYFSIQKSLNQYFEFKLGLRAEATQTKSDFQNLDFSPTKDYIKLFPTVYFSYQSNPQTRLVLSYNRRIERPQFYHLNPNIYFINPFQSIEGNPFLQPAFIDNLELSQTWKNLTSKIYLSYADQLFAQVPLANSDNNQIRFTNENYIQTKKIGVSQFFIFNQLKWWTTNNSLDVNYAIASFNLPENQAQQKGWNARFSTNNDLTLSTSNNLYFNIRYSFNFPGINGIFQQKSRSALSLGLRWQCFDQQLTIFARGNDILKGQAERLTTTVNNVYQEARYYYDSRSIQIGFSFKFGNQNLASKRIIGGNSEERQRAGY